MSYHWLSVCMWGWIKKDTKQNGTHTKNRKVFQKLLSILYDPLFQQHGQSNSLTDIYLYECIRISISSLLLFLSCYSRTPQQSLVELVFQAEWKRAGWERRRLISVEKKCYVYGICSSKLQFPEQRRTSSCKANSKVHFPFLCYSYVYGKKGAQENGA